MRFLKVLPLILLSTSLHSAGDNSDNHPIRTRSPSPIRELTGLVDPMHLSTPQLYTAIEGQNERIKQQYEKLQRHAKYAQDVKEYNKGVEEQHQRQINELKLYYEEIEAETNQQLEEAKRKIDELAVVLRTPLRTRTSSPIGATPRPTEPNTPLVVRAVPLVPVPIVQTPEIVQPVFSASTYLEERIKAFEQEIRDILITHCQNNVRLVSKQIKGGINRDDFITEFTRFTARLIGAQTEWPTLTNLQPESIVSFKAVVADYLSDQAARFLQDIAMRKSTGCGSTVEDSIRFFSVKLPTNNETFGAGTLGEVKAMFAKIAKEAE